MLTYDLMQDGARSVLPLANQRANELQYRELNPDHIFWAMLRRPEDGFPKVMKALGVDLPKLWKDFDAALPTGPGNTTFTKLPRSPAANRALEGAVAEAKALGHEMVGVEHFMLGILHEADCLAARMLLTHAGITLEVARSEVRRLFPPTPCISPQEQAETEKRAVSEKVHRVEEQHRLNDLQQRLAAWEQARTIRMFIRDLRSAAKRRGVRVQAGTSLHRWLQWATAKADGLDPIPGMLNREPDKEKHALHD